MRNKSNLTRRSLTLLFSVLLLASSGRSDVELGKPVQGVVGATEITYFDASRLPETGEKKSFDILWNAKGEVGRAAHYEPIPFQINKENPGYSNYRVLDAQGKPMNNLPSGNGYDLLYGSHDEAVKSETAHYFIAAYTMRNDPADDVWLLNANEWAHSADPSDHLNLKVYVNDRYVYANNETQSVPHGLHAFHTKLGKLKKSDVIYVAVGPGDRNARPQFRLCYTIATLPAGVAPEAPLNILYPPTDVPAPRMLGNGKPHPGYAEHAEGRNKDLREKKPQLVFIGDSITDWWDKDVFRENFSIYNAANMGIASDTIQNLHWRVKRSPLAEIKPRLIVQLIGTNNRGGYSPEEIVSGNAAIIKTLHAMVPETRILLLGVFPTGKSNVELKNNDRIIKPVNEGLAKLADNQSVYYLDIRDQLLEPDGSISQKIFRDGLHLGKEGYVRWAKAILPTVRKLIAGATKPSASADSSPPTYSGVSYGPGANQKLWFWKAESDKPTPLIMNIHGGGWLHGPREPFSRGDQRYLEEGISVAHITYTFTSEKPLPAPVYDAARALQFLRGKAAEWNIDPKRVIVTGFSAGAISALWLATHDDLAKPDSPDPIERQSTRVSGVIASAAQTSIEPNLVREWVGQEGIDHGMVRTAGGFKTNEEMFKAVAERPEVAGLYREFSPINHLSPDDPPILLGYGKAEMGAGGLHGGAFGLKFKERADAVGMTRCYLKIDNDPHHPGYPGGETAFVKSIFNLTETKH